MAAMAMGMMVQDRLEDINRRPTVAAQQCGIASLPADIDAVVADWRKATEGVTPGPWRPSIFGFQIVSDFPEASWQSVVELRTKACTFPSAANEAESQETIARWLARCSPDNITALLDLLTSVAAERDALRARVAEMDGALEPFCFASHSDDDFERMTHVINGVRVIACGCSLEEIRAARRARQQEGGL